MLPTNLRQTSNKGIYLSSTGGDPTTEQELMPSQNIAMSIDGKSQDELPFDIVDKSVA